LRAVSIKFNPSISKFVSNFQNSVIAHIGASRTSQEMLLLAAEQNNHIVAVQVSSGPAILTLLKIRGLDFVPDCIENIGKKRSDATFGHTMSRKYGLRTIGM
jgi:hypothetical protein